ADRLSRNSDATLPSGRVHDRRRLLRTCRGIVRAVPGDGRSRLRELGDVRRAGAYDAPRWPCVLFRAASGGGVLRCAQGYAWLVDGVLAARARYDRRPFDPVSSRGPSRAARSPLHTQSQRHDDANANCCGGSRVNAILTVRDLLKRFGNLAAVDGVNLEI